MYLRTYQLVCKRLEMVIPRGSAVVLVLLPLSSLLLSAEGAAEAELVTWKCDNGTYYATNST
jgi:hypothetical protein